METLNKKLQVGFIGIVKKNVSLLERFFLQPPRWAVAESEDQLCRVSLIRNKIMKRGTNLTGKRLSRVLQNMGIQMGMKTGQVKVVNSKVFFRITS